MGVGHLQYIHTIVLRIGVVLGDQYSERGQIRYDPTVTPPPAIFWGGQPMSNLDKG
jgi:hypothetical protein